VLPIQSTEILLPFLTPGFSNKWHHLHQNSKNKIKVPYFFFAHNTRRTKVDCLAHPPAASPTDDGAIPWHTPI
jgi:hypothetical protein